MRAVLMQDSKLQVAEVAEPVPGPGEVLVDVLACGICGSDLHCAAHGPEFNAATQAAVGFNVMDLDRPVVFGHEFVGRRGLRTRHPAADPGRPACGIDAVPAS
jgi:threonine dehydrogenase-like Zn-dependent dehydrogenase